MLWPMTVPSRTLSAAASVVVPCRLQSFDCRSEIVKRSDPKGFKMLPKRWISTGHSAGSGGAGGSPKASKISPALGPRSSFSLWPASCCDG
jgi:hypothetical protein